MSCSHEWAGMGGGCVHCGVQCRTWVTTMREEQAGAQTIVADLSRQLDAERAARAEAEVEAARLSCIRCSAPKAFEDATAKRIAEWLRNRGDHVLIAEGWADAIERGEWRR